MKPLLRDPLWWAALACGPLFWLGLWLSGTEVQPASRLLSYWDRWLMIVLVYPVLEEIVFRGGVQGWLSAHGFARAWWGVSAANLLTSLIFTALHFIYHPPLWAAAVFLPSLVFGLIRDRHQALTGPILLHIVYNAGYALLFVRFQ